MPCRLPIYRTALVTAALLVSACGDDAVPPPPEPDESMDLAIDNASNALENAVENSIIQQSGVDLNEVGE